jgi:hypothetical protein
MAAFSVASSWLTSLNPAFTINSSFSPFGTNTNNPMELRAASSSLVTGPLITTGSVNMARPPGLSTRHHSFRQSLRFGK